MARFRNWWWESFDCEGDAGEFDAETPEAANELLPIAQNLTWPDFQCAVEGGKLRLHRVQEKHYPRRQEEAPSLLKGTGSA